MARRAHPTFECPHCGARVKRGASACRECGSDALTGWDEEAPAWSAELPMGYSGDPDFDYDEFLKREGLDGSGALAPHKLKRWAWRGLVALVVLVFLLWLIGIA